MASNRINELARMFQQRYSYISCERNVLEEAAAMVSDFPDDRDLTVCRTTSCRRDLLTRFNYKGVVRMKAILKMDEGSKVIVDLLSYPPERKERHGTSSRSASGCK